MMQSEDAAKVIDSMKLQQLNIFSMPALQVRASVTYLSVFVP